MSKTFSQIVQDVLDAVRVVAPLDASTMSHDVLASYAIGALWADGALCPSDERVRAVVESTRDMLAAEQAGHGGA